ncbi:MAG: hypothetical protein KGL93_04520 [Gemmatimonadota bacterium]|nr:hypothetical protein [Gemmatimonadota bacterium]
MPSGPRRTKTLLAVLALAAALAPTAQAQQSTTFIADVADAATGAPIRDAEVVLMDTHRLARTNWMGEAVLSGVPAGSHRVRVRRLGFVAADLELAFRGDTVGQVFMLAEAPKALDTVRVQGARVPPALQPFERRRAMGLGRFLTEAALDSAGQRDVKVVLATRFPGIVIRPDDQGNEELYSLRGFMTKMRIQPCPVSVYLDDVPISQDDVWNLTRTWDLAGVEYYDGLSAPVQYRISGTVCGVLLLWSKEY